MTSRDSTCAVYLITEKQQNEHADDDKYSADAPKDVVGFRDHVFMLVRFRFLSVQAPSGSFDDVYEGVS